MTDGLDTRGRRQEDWDTGNRESLWEHRSRNSQERLQVLSDSRRRVQGKSKRVADLELELAELKRAFAMLAKYVFQREAVSQLDTAVGSPNGAPLASRGEDSDTDLIETATRDIDSVSRVYDVPDHGSLVWHFAERTGSCSPQSCASCASSGLVEQPHAHL